MTEEVKWTPGPWEYNDPSKYQVGHGLFSEVAVYAPGTAFPWRMCEVTGPGDDVAIANARLIAAAPELYEALAVAMIWIDNWSPDFTDDPEWPVDRDKIRAALAKAQGREVEGR